MRIYAYIKVQRIENFKWKAEFKNAANVKL